MKQEWILYALAGVLLAAVCFLAVADAPELAPVGAPYPASSSNRPLSTEHTAATSPKPAAGSIDLNTASKELLMTLPGVGEQRAEAILAHRERYEGFDTVEELAEVEGVGPGLMETLREYLTVSPYVN